MPTLEQIIRPFQNGADVTGMPYVPPGGETNAPATAHAGEIGGTLTFPGDFSFVQTTKIGAVHKEASSNSQTIQNVIANPAA